MRPLTTIGVTFIAAIGVDIGLSFLRPRQWLPISACAIIGEFGSYASLIFVPGLFIFYPFKTRALHSPAIRTLLAVLISWFLILVFRMHFSLPALREMARLRNDDFDGIGGNAALLVGGWILPAIITIIMVAVQESRLGYSRSHPTPATDIRAEPNEELAQK